MSAKVAPSDGTTKNAPPEGGRASWISLRAAQADRRRLRSAIREKLPQPVFEELCDHVTQFTEKLLPSASDDPNSARIAARVELVATALLAARQSRQGVYG